jgi:hypothetical protein
MSPYPALMSCCDIQWVSSSSCLAGPGILDAGIDNSFKSAASCIPHEPARKPLAEHIRQTELLCLESCEACLQSEDWLASFANIRMSWWRHGFMTFTIAALWGQCASRHNVSECHCALCADQHRPMANGKLHANLSVQSTSHTPFSQVSTALASTLHACTLDLDTDRIGESKGRRADLRSHSPASPEPCAKNLKSGVQNLTTGTTCYRACARLVGVGRHRPERLSQTV